MRTPTVAQRLTVILQAWSAGDSRAAADLAELVYPELHKIAQRCFYKERPGHTLQPTALVNEAFLRLARLHDIRWEDRTHFFAVSARFMRRILVEHARKRPHAVRVELTEEALISGVLDPDLAALDEAISALAQVLAAGTSGGDALFRGVNGRRDRFGSRDLDAQRAQGLEPGEGVAHSPHETQ